MAAPNDSPAARPRRRRRTACPRPGARSGRRRTGAPRRSSRRPRRSGASRPRRRPACRRTAAGRARRRRRRRSPRRRRRWCRGRAGSSRPSPGSRPGCRHRPARRRPRGPRPPCRCGRCRSGRRSRPPGDGDHRRRGRCSGRGSGGAAEAAAAGAAAARQRLRLPVTTPRARFTWSTTSSGVSASRRASVNAGFTRARASLVSSWRWVASPPAGAAIRNAMSAGPSFAPKSTFGSSRANARVGSSTPVVRQWGMAIPPGRPVG